MAIFRQLSYCNGVYLTDQYVGPPTNNRYPAGTSQQPKPLVAPGLFPAPSKKEPAPIAGPACIQFFQIYFVQVSLIIFTSVTLKLPIASLPAAFSTCPSFLSSAFVSGLAVPVTVT